MKRKRPPKTKTKSAARSKTDEIPLTFAQAVAVFFREDLALPMGASQHTIQSYKITFRLLLTFVQTYRPELLRDDTPLQRFDAALFRAFFKYLDRERHSSAATMNVRRAACCALIRSVQRRYPQLGVYGQSILAIPSRKSPEPLVGYFDLDELEVIFRTIDTTTPDGFRNMVLLRCLYNTGARASELCALRQQDLRLDEPPHLVLHGKGGKVRTVALWPVTVDLLIAYMKAARRTPQPGYAAYVFINRKGRPLTRHGLYRIARSCIERAAEVMPKLRREEIHPVCSFRHTTATHLLQAGESLTVIQEILGHKRPETTCRYRAVNLETKRRAIEKLWELRQQTSPSTSSATKADASWTHIAEALDWLERL